MRRMKAVDGSSFRHTVVSAVRATEIRARPYRLSVPVAIALGARAVCAHPLGTGADNATGWSAWPWSFEPWVLACLALSLALYAVGLLQLWRRAGADRGVRWVHVASFMGAWLVLVVALVSPLDPLGSRLFSAHMIQHELLMIVAAPLFVAGRPLAVWIWAFPQPWRRRIGRFFHKPAWRVPWLFVTGTVCAWVLHALALWLWHIPALFELALRNEWVHAFQHFSFLFTALLFWWTVVAARSRRDQAIAGVSLFTTMLHMGALGAFLTLASSVWYPTYLGTASAFSLSALEDQQLGGLVMWIPSGLIYIVCLVAIAARLLEDKGARPHIRQRVAVERGGTGEGAEGAYRTSPWLGKTEMAD